MSTTTNMKQEPGLHRSRVVIDTSIFINPETQRLFGDTAGEALQAFLTICRESSLAIFLPLSIYRELSNFIPPELLKPLRSQAVVRDLDLYNIHVPAAIFHAFIRDLRLRVNKGLNIAEKAIKSADLPETVRWVRQQYRDALRSGIVDSVEDLEVVLMAREIDGVILTSDKGIATMAGSLGTEVFSAEEFIHYANTRKEK